MTPFERVKEAITGACADRGWIPLEYNAVYREVSHETPDRIPAHWCPSPTYTSFDVLTFLFTGPDRVPTVFHRCGIAPWVAVIETRIPFTQALELLAAETA